MKKRLASKLLLAIGLFFLAISWAGADDGAVSGVGGSLRLMQEHPSIAMTAERVTIELTPSRAEVDCIFYFENHGPATRVRMGFPESGGGDGSSGFSQFASWVDGRRVKTRIEGLERRGGDWNRWRTKTVSFAAHQRRLVRVRYRAPLGGDISGHRSFSYRLDTGGSWKGAIKAAEVILRLRGIPDYYSLEFSPAGYRRRGNVVSWQWRNLEPARSDQARARRTGEPGFEFISAGFFPGYTDLFLNGQAVDLMQLADAPPRLIEGRPWVWVGQLARWTDSRLERPANSDTVVLTNGTRTVALRAGSCQVLLSGSTAQLNRAPRIFHRRLYVPAIEVLELLGGSGRFDAKSGATSLFFPAAKEKTAGR